MNLADRPLPNQLAGELVDRHGSLLRTGLENALVLLDRVGEVSPLGNRQCHRLLGINVPTGLEDVNARQYPGVGRRLDEDGVELLLLEHLPIMLVYLPLVAAGNCLGGLMASGKKTIRGGDHLGSGESLAGQDPVCPTSQANEAKLDSIIGPGPPRSRQRSSRD